MNTFIDSQTFWSAAAPAKAADRGPGYRWEAEAICVHYQMALDGRLWSLDDVLATSFGFFFLFFFWPSVGGICQDAECNPLLADDPSFAALRPRDNDGRGNDVT